MEKEFIPYEEAFALKELGFDEPCFGRFSNEGNLVIAHTEKYIISDGVDRSEFFTQAPTFPQAFRWFREKHSLHSNVKCINTTYNNHFRFEIESNSETLYCRNLFDTHEEAELACLRKLIEIVKQGGNNES